MSTTHREDDTPSAVLRRTVHRLMLETVPRLHAYPSFAMLLRFVSPQVPGIDEEVLRSVITTIAQDPASGLILSCRGQIRRRLTPAEIYATHRDMKQHLAASALLRTTDQQPMVENRLFAEAMKALILTTSDGPIWRVNAQFCKGVSELFGEQWAHGYACAGGKKHDGRSLQDLPDKASIVARNRDLVAALEEGSTAVPFPLPAVAAPPAPQVVRLPDGGTHRVVRDPAHNQPGDSAELRRTVHRLMLETVPHTHSIPTLPSLVRFVSPKVPGIDQKALRSVITTIIEDPTSGFVWKSSCQMKRRLTPAEIYAMHRDIKQHLAASTLRSSSGLPVVESRVVVEAMKTLLLTTSEGTATRLGAQFYKGVSELFGEQWAQGYVCAGGKKITSRSLQDLPDKASIVARNRDLIAALEEGSTAVPFPPPGPRQCHPAHPTEVRDVVRRLMLETVPQVHAIPTPTALVRFISPKVPDIDEKVLRSVINTIVEEAASGFAFSSHGQVRRRLTPAEIYAMHRDMKQHLAASAIRSSSGRPTVECRVFIESMKALVLTTSPVRAAAMGRQFYKGVSELFGEHWVPEQVSVGVKAISCRSLQDLPDKASIVARNRDLIAALEEGSTAVPFPPPPVPRQCQSAHSTEVRAAVRRLMLETVPHIHTTLSPTALIRFISPKIPGVDEKVLRSIITTIVDDPASGFTFSHNGCIRRRLTSSEIYEMHRDMKQHLAASALRSSGGQPMVECRVFIAAMQTLVVTTLHGRAARLAAQFYTGVSELFGEQWAKGSVKVGGKKINGRSLQDLPDKASIVARNRDLIAALEEGSTAVPFPPPAPLPAEAPAVAAPAVQRRGRGVAPKRQREAGPSDTEGRRAAHT